MVKTFHLSISLPNRICLDKQCAFVNMPTETGYITILPNHEPIIGALAPGYITVTFEDGSKDVSLINQGVFYFKENEMVILSDFYEKADKVNTKALDAIKQKIKDAMIDEKLSDKYVKKLNSFMKVITTEAEKVTKKN